MKPVTAADLRPGDLWEFPLIPIVEARPVSGGPWAGYIYVEYARAYDDSGNRWRLYPAHRRLATRHVTR